ncbi:hypothetical protein LAZ67_1007108 [Cordylochernes scorpioides]|uniref:Uncharacterized protein n=1 Tax=Cordylochernes scorpioides TaxID=51811 RepID=A0ABY6JZI1_9ARAC|nr:hypothetical protein LAZ67_1007108 [Cordylochernes scorpioides]
MFTGRKTSTLFVFAPDNETKNVVYHKMGIAVKIHRIHSLTQAISRVNALGRVPRGLGGKAAIYLNYIDFETTKWIVKNN